jgi:plastocyanin
MDGSEAIEHVKDTPVVEVGADDELSEDVSSDATSISVGDSDGFAEGAILQVDDELMRVVSVSGDTLEVERGVNGTKAKSHAAKSTVEHQVNVIEVERGVGGTTASGHAVKVAVYEMGNEVVVVRGVFGTEAAGHEVNTEVFNGPIAPADSITGEGEGFPPCGQLKPRPAVPAAEVTVAGSVDVTMGDNFFDSGGNQNPTFKLAAGSAVTFNFANNGKAPHNMRVAGADGEYDNDDDSVSDPDLIVPGQTGALQFTAEAAGTFDYRCDFHPDQMKGSITAE